MRNAFNIKGTLYYVSLKITHFKNGPKRESAVIFYVDVGNFLLLFESFTY